LAKKFSSHLANPRKTGLNRRALNQAARELLLAEASDWPFIMKTGTMVPYAKKRVTQHIAQFTRLYENLLANAVDRPWLEDLERRDNIFHDIDCAAYYSEEKYRVPARSRGAVVAGPARKPRKKESGRAKPKSRRASKPKSSPPAAPGIKDKKLVLV